MRTAAAAVALALALALSGAAAPAAAATHNFLAPTGETMTRGEANFQLHAFGGWNQILYGLTDRVELSAAAPVIPIVALMGVRVSLTGSETPGKLVVGGGVGVPLLTMEDDAGMIYWASVTVGYRAGRFDLHASAWAIGVSQQDGAPSLAIATAGIGLSTSKDYTLFLDVGKFSVGMAQSCDAGGEGCGSDEDSLRGFQLGLKFLGKNLDTDVGIIAPVFSNRMVLYPMISMTFHR